MNFSKIAKMLLSFSLLCCFCLSADVLTEEDWQKAQAVKDGKVYVDEATKAKFKAKYEKRLKDAALFNSSNNEIKSLNISNDLNKTKNDMEDVVVETQKIVVKTKNHPNQAKIDYYNDLKLNPPHQDTYDGRDCVDTNYDADGNELTDGWDGCADYIEAW